MFLRANGIDARLDLPAAEGRQDWAQWTAREVRDADRILVVASPEYRRRDVGDAEPDEGRGVQFEARTEPALTVAFAPVKGERPEWVVQKLTELGIDRIVPLLSERSVVRWSGARGKSTVERLRRVAREAAAQCRRVWLPDVGDTVRFVDLHQLGRAGEVVLAQLSGDRPNASQRVVAVGPEGGWSTTELASGLPTVGFGLSVLRAETAAVTAGALLASLRTGTVAVADGPGTKGPPA